MPVARPAPAGLVSRVVPGLRRAHLVVASPRPPCSSHRPDRTLCLFGSGSWQREAGVRNCGYGNAGARVGSRCNQPGRGGGGEGHKPPRSRHRRESALPWHYSPPSRGSRDGRPAARPPPAHTCRRPRSGASDGPECEKEKLRNELHYRQLLFPFPIRKNRLSRPRTSRANACDFVSFHAIAPLAHHQQRAATIVLLRPGPPPRPAHRSARHPITPSSAASPRNPVRRRPDFVARRPLAAVSTARPPTARPCLNVHDRRSLGARPPGARERGERALDHRRMTHTGPAGMRP